MKPTRDVRNSDLARELSRFRVQVVGCTSGLKTKAAEAAAAQSVFDRNFPQPICHWKWFTGLLCLLKTKSKGTEIHVIE